MQIKDYRIIFIMSSTFHVVILHTQSVQQVLLTIRDDRSVKKEYDDVVIQK
ncbi:hypothetical protein [Rickettsiales endosymbiont of Peranema trichophorum]|uniref:hypothetical protein n=1 Tax=Rickettsiales endosymbiont of Peranema trichophorum TaxID=2486577 RepID=UPI001A9235BD|nr:hypothetical protein [Rickettsiales endosymbiont of Peranema trichophorum]